MATKTATNTAATKTAKVKAIPTGYHAITPYLIFDGAARAIEFYQRAFNAKELLRIPAPNERIGHAEIKVGDSVVMMADEHPEMDAYAPTHFGGSALRDRRGRDVQAGPRRRRYRGAPGRGPVLR